MIKPMSETPFSRMSALSRQMIDTVNHPTTPTIPNARSQIRYPSAARKAIEVSIITLANHLMYQSGVYSLFILLIVPIHVVVFVFDHCVDC